MNNIVSKNDAISFLIASKSYIQESDFDEILPNLIENLYDYLKRIPKSLFERNLFYTMLRKCSVSIIFMKN